MDGFIRTFDVKATNKEHEEALCGAFRKGTEMEKITFNDGTVIAAEKNGNCFIVDEKPDFPEDLTDIIIEGEEINTVENGRIVEAASIDGRYWFTIQEMSEDELWKAEIEDALCDLSRE